MSSPRMWGCSHVHDDESAQIVFPTHVGMFRALYAEIRGRVFPTHVGMFLSGSPTSHSVFPTHVGMFLCGCSRLSLPHACGGFPKKQNFSFLLASRKCLLYKCFQRTDTCRFSFKSFVCCAVRVPVYWTGYGSVEDTRHISALFVNLTFHLRRNHHVRRICSRS